MLDQPLLTLNDPDLFRQHAYIDGVWVDADSGETSAITNPATGEVLGSVPHMGQAETKRAIEAAERRDDWSVAASLMEALRQPYVERPGLETWAEPAPTSLADAPGVAALS